MEYQNAIIEKADIGYEGHGILTISLVFKGKGWGQGLPGYRLDGCDAMSRFIDGILKTMEVEWWSCLVGKTCQIGRESGIITRVGGPLADKDCPGDWFDAPSVAIKCREEWEGK